MVYSTGKGEITFQFITLEEAFGYNSIRLPGHQFTLTCFFTILSCSLWLFDKHVPMAALGFVCVPVYNRLPILTAAQL